MRREAREREREQKVGWEEREEKESQDREKGEKKRVIDVNFFFIGLMSRVFTNGQGDWGSIPGRVIPKTQKWYLMPPCLTLSIIREGSRLKWSNPENRVAPSTTPQCSSYWKGSLQVTNFYSYLLQWLFHFSSEEQSGQHTIQYSR